MQMSESTLNIDIGDVKDLLVPLAKRELMPRFAAAAKQIKPDGSLVTEADLAMQKQVSAALRERWPDIPLVGEETPTDEQRSLFAMADRPIWCLDPVDGTSNFAAGIPFFAVSLALLVNRRPLLGVVYDPARDELFAAAADAGAWLNGERLLSQRSDLPLQHCIGVVDFKRLNPPLATRLAQHPPYSSQRSFGSVALDWCWLAANRFHVYLHGKQKIWDYAAGWLILNEAQGRSCTLEGEPVFTDAMAPRSAVAALDEELFQEWYQWLAAT